jgi:hypothetical protein
MSFKFFNFLVNFFYVPNLIFNFKTSYKKLINNNYLIIKTKKIKFISDLVIQKYYIDLLKIKKKKRENLKKNKKGFSFELNDFFSGEQILKINSVLKDRETIKKISYYFGYKVKFNETKIYYHYYNKNSPANLTTKMWHRDNDSLFGQLKLFIICNRLSKKIDGRFYFIPKKFLPEHIRVISKEVQKQNLSNADKKSRIMDSDVDKLKLSDKIIKFDGSSAEALILNTNDQYHKGGYIKKSNGFRLMIMATYLPKHFYIGHFSKYFIKYSFYKWITIILIGIKNRFREKIYI